MIGLGLMINSGSRLSSPYDPDAEFLFARFDEPASVERKILINDRFVEGKKTTWWNKLDALWVHAAHGPEAGRLNWISSRYNCLPVNNPTFTPDRGYMGDGVTSYLDTQFNPARAEAANYSQNSGSIGIRSNTDNASGGSLAGFWDGEKGTTINPRTANNRLAVRLNQPATIETSSGVSSSSVGMFAVSRESATLLRGYINGVSQSGSSSSPSSEVADGALRLGSISNDSLRACEFCMGWIGGGLKPDEVLGIFNWFEPYRLALGVV